MPVYQAFLLLGRSDWVQPCKPTAVTLTGLHSGDALRIEGNNVEITGSLSLSRGTVSSSQTASIATGTLIVDADSRLLGPLNVLVNDEAMIQGIFGGLLLR